MSDTKQFLEENTLYPKDAKKHLGDVKDLLRWQDNENILDVGCGDGQVTSTVLFPLIPKNAKQLVGLDISEVTIDDARNRSKNPKISYVTLDIAGQMPEEFKENFDHIFSFYCLTMVEDQRATFQNLFEMLKPGGQMMLSLVLKSSILDCMSDISKNQKWDAFMDKTYLSKYPYQFVDNPGHMLLDILSLQGFNLYFFKVYTKKHSFLTSISKKLLREAFPLLNIILEDLREDFEDDYENAIKSNGIEVVGNTVFFNVLVATVLVSK